MFVMKSAGFIVFIRGFFHITVSQLFLFDESINTTCTCCKSKNTWKIKKNIIFITFNDNVFKFKYRCAQRQCEALFTHTNNCW